jgi:hypothetical protein
MMFFLGVTVGIAIVILYALWLAARTKANNSANGTIAFTTLDTRTPMEAANEHFLKGAIEQASDHRLWEVQTHNTRH